MIDNKNSYNNKDDADYTVVWLVVFQQGPLCSLCEPTWWEVGDSPFPGPSCEYPNP